MRTIWLFAIALLVCAPAFARGGGQSNAPSTAPSGAEESLSHDRHDGLNISADPYIDVERAKKKFGKANPIPAGILPVEVFLRNETNQPIRIDLSTIQLEVRPPEGKRQDVDSLSPVEVANQIVHPEGSRTPSTRRSGLCRAVASSGRACDCCLPAIGTSGARTFRDIGMLSPCGLGDSQS